MNKQIFFDKVRKDLFDSKLSNAQVIGLEYLLDLMAIIRLNLWFAAYILATAYWETGKTMEPVKEAYWLTEDWRRKNLRYFPFYGRGYVQLTWKENYQKAKDWFASVLKLDRDFVGNPDLALDRESSALITIVGMLEGWFTGKKLADYIDGLDDPDAKDRGEFKGARRIVNGTDKDAQIAEFALKFEKALVAAGYEGDLKEPDYSPLFAKTVVPGRPEVIITTPDAPQNPAGKIVAAILGLLGVLYAILEALNVL